MRLIMLLTLPLLVTGTTAHPGHDGDQKGNVVPLHEREISHQMQAQGPQENRGIESVTTLGHVSLAGEIGDDSNRILRAREIVIAPGGVVAVHQHDQRPGVAYIIEGELIEHRSDADGPLVRKPGAVSFERTGVTHWWDNRSDQRARALVIDIVPQNSTN